MPRSKRHNVSRLEDHVGYWLRFVSNHVSATFARKLEKFGISVSEWVAMRKLYDETGPVSATSLAETMGMTKAPVSRLVERLVQKELVNRQDSREDGRAQEIWLSTGGRQLVPKLAAIADANDDAFFGDLPENTRGALIAILQQIVLQSKLSQIPVD